jgi:hypothetical protein
MRVRHLSEDRVHLLAIGEQRVLMPLSWAQRGLAPVNRSWRLSSVPKSQVVAEPGP